MAIDDWIITTGIAALVAAAIKTPTLYREYLYGKVFAVSISILVLAAAYHAGLYVALHSIPESFTEEQTKLLQEAFSKFQAPDKWYYALLAVMFGNFILESVANAVIKHEKAS